jgi:hypothetical protein
MNETLKLMHYLDPTEIQKYVIPAVIGLRDLVVSAQTGSGKTVSYLCPIFSNLMGRAHQICAPKFNLLATTLRSTSSGLNHWSSSSCLLVSSLGKSSMTAVASVIALVFVHASLTVVAQ